MDSEDPELTAYHEAASALIRLLKPGIEKPTTMKEASKEALANEILCLVAGTAAKLRYVNSLEDNTDRPEYLTTADYDTAHTVAACYLKRFGCPDNPDDVDTIFNGKKLPILSRLKDRFLTVSETLTEKEVENKILSILQSATNYTRDLLDENKHVLKAPTPT
ncbi:MAG: hypothetical protein KAJ40_07980 [Alphaproteobacteria bacterium]|nr:hypothetical protein [Alphaproteobacteria bacterium]